MLKKVLVANRGEIALRVIRACRDMGIKTVAVYSEADRHSLHVRSADEAYFIGPAPSKESYLVIPKILEVVKKSGADAIHPGYGFLSERAEFAEACEKEGIIFIGPPSSAIRAMGDKVTAKQVARAAGVPLAPGTDREITDANEAKAIADSIGYPVLIKASAGGGGKGLRVVRDPKDIVSSFEATTREAMGAFGYGGVYIEKLLENVKHIEIQILCDAHGNAIYLGERECSLQRRNQKILEEAPSMAVDPDLRSRMGEVALAVARKVGYVNAGTIEFLLTQDKQFYFMEMNTRLQVEHPVTERVTGIDIVTEQLRIAAGMPLRYKQEDVKIQGWSVECRITAEDPYNNFLPSIGMIDRVVPPGGPGIRLDSAVFDGCEISLYYDPMIAKLITHGNDRTQAISRMLRALEEYRIYGVKTSRPYFKQLLTSEPFVTGQFFTTSLETNPALKPTRPNDTETIEAAMIAAALVDHYKSIGSSARAGTKASSGGSAESGLDRSSQWKLTARREALRRG